MDNLGQPISDTTVHSFLQGFSQHANIVKQKDTCLFLTIWSSTLDFHDCKQKARKLCRTQLGIIEYSLRTAHFSVKINQSHSIPLTSVEDITATLDNLVQILKLPLFLWSIHFQKHTSTYTHSRSITETDVSVLSPPS